MWHHLTAGHLGRSSGNGRLAAPATFAVDSPAMAYSTAVLGTSAVRRLQLRADTPIVVIGSDRFSRTDLAQVQSFNYIAAATLSHTIATLRVKNTSDLFLKIDPSALAQPGIGVYAYAVLGAIFELKELGTLDEWIARSLTKGAPLVTVSTLKHRLQKDTTKTVARSRKTQKG